MRESRSFGIGTEPGRLCRCFGVSMAGAAIRGNYQSIAVLLPLLPDPAYDRQPTPDSAHTLAFQPPKTPCPA